MVKNKNVFFAPQQAEMQLFRRVQKILEAIILPRDKKSILHPSTNSGLRVANQHPSGVVTRTQFLEDSKLLRINKKKRPTPYTSDDNRYSYKLSGVCLMVLLLATSQ